MFMKDLCPFLELKICQIKYRLESQKCQFLFAQRGVASD